jgi:hypothetical protein
MLTVKLKEFITQGNFGPVQLGMHIDKVIALLGEPQSKHDFDNGHSEIFYAWYEFFYETQTGIVYSIQNDHLATFANAKTGRVNNKKDICFSNNTFTIDIWFLKKNRYMTYINVYENLKKENLLFEIKLEDGLQTITLPSGVRLDFDDQRGLSYYDDKTKTWTHAEPIKDLNNHIFCSIRHWDWSIFNKLTVS